MPTYSSKGEHVSAITSRFQHLIVTTQVLHSNLNSENHYETKLRGRNNIVKPFQQHEDWHVKTRYWRAHFDQRKITKKTVHCLLWWSSWVEVSTNLYSLITTKWKYVLGSLDNWPSTMESFAKKKNAQCRMQFVIFSLDSVLGTLSISWWESGT